MNRTESLAWMERAKRRIPGCAQTFSKGPLSFVQGVAPNFLARAKGAYAWDVDGNRYIDYILGLGPIILGHCDPVVNEAVHEQLETGVSFSLPHPSEVELSELICDLVPCAEMVRFGKNGSDVTTAAIRVSRAFTRRNYVARCGYHGWQDWYIGSTSRYLGVPDAVRKLTLSFRYNDLEAVDNLFRTHPGQIACVILEAMTFDLPEPGYLEGLRDICTKNGTLLIFDEVITGFRLSLGGAQALFDVTPDLACFGKAIANGLPLSAIAGKAEVMEWFEQVFFSGTHGGEAVSIAAALATIRELQRRNGIEELYRIGTALQDGTRSILKYSGLDEILDCAGLPAWTTLRFKCDSEKASLDLRSLFQQEALKRGILTHGNHMLSLAHTDQIVSDTLQVYSEVFPILAHALTSGDVAERLEGASVRPALRQ